MILPVDFMSRQLVNRCTPKMNHKWTLDGRECDREHQKRRSCSMLDAPRAHSRLFLSDSAIVARKATRGVSATPRVRRCRWDPVTASTRQRRRTRRTCPGLGELGEAITAGLAIWQSPISLLWDARTAGGLYKAKQGMVPRNAACSSVAWRGIPSSTV